MAKRAPRPAATPLQAYVRDLADRLGLRDWTIRIDKEPASDGACAEIQCLSGQKRAILALGKNFYTPEDCDTAGEIADWQRHTLVHELVHCHLASARQSVEDALDALAKPKASDAVFVSIDLQLEYATDAVADVVAPLMPLPNLPVPAPAPARKRVKKQPVTT